jgi:excisionase family DNA binding protein
MRTDGCLSGDRLALRMRELAKALNLSVRTIWGLTKAGVIPHVRVGGSVLYPIDAVHQWLQEQAKANVESAQAVQSASPASVR